MTSGRGFLARLASWHVHPGAKVPWWIVPAWLLLDALGFLCFGWVISNLWEADIRLAMHADVAKIMPAVAIVILSLPALFPVVHVIAVVVNVGRRRPPRRPVLGLKENQWWRIMAILASAWFLIAVAYRLDDRLSPARAGPGVRLYRLPQHLRADEFGARGRISPDLRRFGGSMPQGRVPA
jgi:hypothetical protein